VAGDWVIVKGERVVKVLSRRNELRRTQTHGRPAQVLAANVDVVLIVIPLRGELHHRMIEGLTAMARDSGAKALIVISKSDEGPESEVEDIKRRIAALVGEVSVLVTSSHHGEGVELLRETLGPGVTGVLLGASGAGKTSLLNALEGRVERTKTLSRTGEGRHATSTRKLYRLSSGGVLLDIPGVRFSRAVADAQSSGEDYADLELLGESCRFANCHHRRDDGCAVTLAVESGELSRLRVEQWLTWREVVASSTTTPPH
jgi:ribosome biogenesis GTPase